MELSQRDLTLRPASPEDLAVLQGLVTADLGDRWTRSMYDGGRRPVDRPGVEVHAVVRDGQVIGLIDVKPLSGGQHVELGWWIDPSQRGRHTASRVTVLVVAGLRREWVARISARLATTNHRSRWVAASAGLRPEATLRALWDDDDDPAARLDVEVWSLLAGDEPREAQPELTAGSLHLRPLHPSDAPRIAASCKDELSQRWLHGLPRPYTEDDGRDFVAHNLHTWAAGGDVVWGFCDTVTSELLGCVGLHQRIGGSWREVGWHCFADARGRGATAQAAAAVARWGRGALGLQRIDARIEPANAASIRVAQKAGFSLEATLAHTVPARDGTTVESQIWLWP